MLFWVRFLHSLSQAGTRVLLSVLGCKTWGAFESAVSIRFLGFKSPCCYRVTFPWGIWRILVLGCMRWTSAAGCILYSHLGLRCCWPKGNPAIISWKDLKQFCICCLLIGIKDFACFHIIVLVIAGTAGFSKWKTPKTVIPLEKVWNRSLSLYSQLVPDLFCWYIPAHYLFEHFWRVSLRRK